MKRRMGRDVVSNDPLGRIHEIVGSYLCRLSAIGITITTSVVARTNIQIASEGARNSSQLGV